MARSVSPAAEAEPGSSPPLPSQMEVDLAAEAGNSSPEEEDIPMADAGDIQPLVEKAEPTTEAPAAQEETDADGDAPVVIEQEKRPEIKLEDLFDGMSSDDEDFPSSSHPQPAQEPPSSQGYAPDFHLEGRRRLTATQGARRNGFQHRALAHLLPALLPLAIHVPVAEPQPNPYQRLQASRVQFVAAQRCRDPIPIICHLRTVSQHLCPCRSNLRLPLN